MTNIRGKNITLRAVEPADVNYLYEWENDTSIWSASATTSPFSHHTLSLFIESQREDIFSSRQQRLMICNSEGLAIGAVDLFEFDPLAKHAGVGIVISAEHQRLGYATDALTTLASYAKSFLNIHQLWCNIEEDNHKSIALFESIGYQHIGTKRDWIISPNGEYRSELMYQLILSDC